MSYHWLFYALILQRVKRQIFFAYIQIGIDTFVVTLIIYVTVAVYVLPVLAGGDAGP